jgi:hypothetical protein
MTTTTAPATRIGVCRWNSEHRFFTETAPTNSFCPLCEPVTVEWYGRQEIQRASIKWATVKGRTTSTKCTGVCRSAASDRCACECGGRNHGKSLEPHA